LPAIPFIDPGTRGGKIIPSTLECMLELKAAFEAQDIGFQETKPLGMNFNNSTPKGEEFMCVGGFHVGELDGGIDILEADSDCRYGDCCIVGCTSTVGVTGLLLCSARRTSLGQGTVIGRIGQCHRRCPSNQSSEHEGNRAVGSRETPLRHVIEKSAKIGWSLCRVLLG
jgi:hypothetical protein